MSKRKHYRLPTEPAEALVTQLSHDGRGIAHLNGKITFIRNALPQEKVKFRYTLCRHAFDEGEAIEIIEPSPLRVSSNCAAYPVCGGCSLRHFEADAQLQHKQASLLEQLKHFGNVEPQHVLPPIIGEREGYRHKARLGVRHVSKKETTLVGFRETNGRFLTDMQSCENLHPSVGHRIGALRELLSSLEAKTEIPQIEVAIGDDQTAFIFRHLVPLSPEDTQKLIDFAKIHTIELYLQPGNAKTVHKIWPLQTPERLSYCLPQEDITLQFHPCDFTQVNPSINRQLVTRALELLEPQPSDNVLDLFCGLGNFTLPLAKRCQHVTGIEGDETMVQRATDNAALNHITNVHFYAANLADPKISQPWAKQHYSKILLDPPRTGAQEIIAHFPAFKAHHIVYVSCNPATLARDAGILVHEQGYRLIHAGVIDMFPHTSHVESMAVFEKSSRR